MSAKLFSAAAPPLPRWAELSLLPLLNLVLALALAALVMYIIGQDPVQVITALVRGALGGPRNLSYTLYYATSFVFTGLAVAVAFHGGLFNIGGEGQATLGGLGAGLVALWLSHSLPPWLMLPLMVLTAMLFGLLWGAIPGYLQAWRGSHIVISTIMFNFLASTLLVYLLVNWLKVPGSMSVESETFAASAHLPRMHEMLAWVGIEWPSSPLNASVFLAALAALSVQGLLWHTLSGYRLRAVGAGASAAHYAGINPKRQVLWAMACSGGLAGLVGVNEIAGVSGRLLLDFVSGAGFTGIAVALMGRNHPVGIVLASLLFGALFQGGAEVAFDVPGFTRDMVLLLQGLVVLSCGALSQILAPGLARVLAQVQAWRRPVPDAASAGAAHG